MSRAGAKSGSSIFAAGDANWWRVVAERKTYRVGEKELSQSELTLKQLRQLIKLFNDTDLDLNNFTPNTLVEVLADDKLFTGFLEVIFGEPVPEEDLDVDTFLEIVVDFFTCNMPMLQKIMNDLGSKAEQLMAAVRNLSGPQSTKSDSPLPKIS